jgi:alkanesulfonate monooxygenase SsuD/methylene tetrahydromethanopterin reductase-like flavin-dependent oxidoreductase (luciferase family)
MAYPDWPEESKFESARITMPNKYFDPERGRAYYQRYLDEFVIADDEGLDLMVNEHHQTPTCLITSAPMMLGILGRITRKGRLLILGNPLPQRLQPVRVAEEMAMIDVISGGRLECGFVRGVPFEIAPANSNPVRMQERMWEAHDLILKAWTTREGPFSFEGKYYSYRAVNIWPRPFQQPHPPIWITGTSPYSAGEVGRRGYKLATFATGYASTPKVFQAYRDGWAAAHTGPPPLDKLAYCGLTYVGETDREGRAGGEQVLWFFNRSERNPSYYANPPGYVPPVANVQALRAGIQPRNGGRPFTVDEAIEQGILFCGNPDTVFNQIQRFYEKVGGFGNWIAQAQGGFLDHDATVKGIRLLAREVHPRLQRLTSQRVAA